jgi:hypothetical protein
MSSSGFWLKVSAFVAFIVLFITTISPFTKHVKFNLTQPYHSNKVTFKAPRENVWADLSKKEADGIANFLFATSQLNLTDSTEATRLVAFILKERDTKRYQR